MAQVLWTNHPTDKTKNGKKEHIAREAASTALTFGWCEIVPRIPYGAKGFLEQRAEEVAAATPNPDDTNIPFVNPPDWLVTKSPYTDRPLLLRRAGFETTSFEDALAAEHHGCPAPILKQFAEMKKVPTPADQLEASKRAQAEQEAREKNARRW